MGRPALAIGTYGKIKTAQEGRMHRATCQFRDFDGVVKKVSRWRETKAKAENALRQAIRDKQQTSGELSAETMVVDLAKMWFAEFEQQVELGNRSGTSYDTFDNRWTKLLKPRVQGFRIRELTAGRIDTILQDINRKLSASTAKNCRAVLSGMCSLAVRHGALETNPVRDVRPVEHGKRKKVPRALIVEEVLHIFELCDGDVVAQRQDLPDIMRYFAGTGYRTGETLAIRWEHIDFADKVAWMGGNAIRTRAHGRMITGGKSANSQRGVPLADWLVDMLRDRQRRVAEMRGLQPDHLTGWVFPNSLGGLREASNMRRDWRAFRDRHHIGAWFTPRTFRSTVATLLTDALPTREASDVLGHSKVSLTTDVYVGRGAPSRRPADVLSVLGNGKNESKTEPDKTDDDPHPM